MAKQFVKDAGTISTVIVASGETEVDAVTASGLAGNLNAPVLLTRSNRLPHNVARFIDENNVSTVIIVGGTSSVPDDIETTILGLGSKPKVNRVSGADRYETAARIGSELGGPNPTWCKSTQTAAILVNGGAEGRADAIVAGPLAYALGLPVLLTAADELPDSTADFLTDEKVERVVIIGGESAVSADIEDHLVEIVGVTSTVRYRGPNAAATSVKIAKDVMLGDCADAVSTNKDMVALVNRDATSDGIAAAPTLGRGPGNSGPVPILLVGDELPAEVSDYLSSTVEVRDGNKTHLKIVAIGGKAVVSEAVMEAAVDAAKTSPELTATINIDAAPTGVSKYIKGGAPASLGGLKAAQANDTASSPPDPDPCPNAVTKTKLVGDYTCQFRVTFSDNVKLPEDGDDTDAVIGDSESELRGTVADPTMYYLNGRRLEGEADGATGDQEKVTVRKLVFTADRTVTITLSHHLDAGDVIMVCPDSDCKIGTKKDMRKLQKAELELPAVTPVRDTAAPQIEIIAVPGLSYFDVIVREPNIGFNELGSTSSGTLTLKDTAAQMDALGSKVNEFIKITGATIPANAAIGAGTAGRLPTPRTIKVSASNSTQPAAVAGDGMVRMRFDVMVENKNPVDRRTDQFGPSASDAVDTSKLRAGDVITVRSGAVRDTGNRLSLSKQFTVPQVKTSPGAKYRSSGALEIERVSMGEHVHNKQATALIGPSGSEVLTIAAHSWGVAAGAAGNGWKIFGYDDRRDGEASSDAFDIDVDVDKLNQRISYTVSDVKPRKSINRVATIEDLATALFNNDDFRANFGVTWVGANRDREQPLGPTSPAGVSFGATTETKGTTQVGVVVKFNAAITALTGTSGTDLAYDIAPKFPGAPGVTDTTADAPDDLSVSPTAATEFPTDMVYIRYTSDSMSELPARTGFRVIAAGLVTGYHDDTVRRLYGCTGDTVASCADASGAQAAAQLVAIGAANAVTNARYILTSLYLNSAIPPRN